MRVTCIKIKLLLALAGAVCLLVSCVEWVSLNTEDPRELVLNCVLTDSDEQSLQLCWSSSNDDVGDPPNISEAEIILSRIQGENAMQVGHFNYDGKGLWKLMYRPESGVRYRISVSTDWGTLSAETEMPGSFSCETVPNPALIVHPDRVLDLCYPSRRIVPENPSETLFEIVAWFTGRDGIIEELYTTHDSADSFNHTGGGFLFEYHSFSAPMQLDEGKAYVHYFPYYNKVAVIPVAKDYSASYFFPAYQSASSSSLNLINIPAMLSNHPEYGAYIRDGIVWGSNFDIWPNNIHKAATLHILKPSASLLAYIRSVIALSPVAENIDFTSIFKYESPYTNIEGGRGIFGAAYVYEEDYTDYDRRMRTYYQQLYEDEKNRQNHW